jgi:organic hydroperoxide reductase OsmC/OhrA
MTEEVSVVITRQDRYKFLVDFGKGISQTLVDEPEPLGESAGPSPVQLLAAAIANCLSVSFVFANAKFKEEPGKVETRATCRIGRNERNRLRVSEIDVTITLGTPTEQIRHLDRILAQFEDFCTVSKSVQAGIPLRVHVTAADGRVLK